MSEESSHLLIVDDDAEIRTLLGAYLGRNGFSVTLARDGASCFAALARNPVDLVVLDIMMPGEDGLSVCRRLREEWSIPVIFLSALDGVTDRVVGLEIGADDYVVKPFEPRELLARIRTVLRRTRGVEEKNTGHIQYFFSGWTLDSASRDLHDPDGILVGLSDAQFRLLVLFLESPFQVLSRDTFLNKLHGRDSEPFDRSIDIQVSRLRNRLRDTGENRLIRTVRGGGYLFASDVVKKGGH